MKLALAIVAALAALVVLLGVDARVTAETLLAVSVLLLAAVVAWIVAP